MNNPVHADAISNIHATLAGSEDILNARAVMLGRNNTWNCVQRTRNEKAPLSSGKCTGNFILSSKRISGAKLPLAKRGGNALEFKSPRIATGAVWR